MKKNNVLKIVTLILSCILLVGAVIGISVSAEDAPTVEIKAKNLSYEGAIRVLYAVDAQNIPEGAEVKMQFTYGDTSYVKSADAKDITVGDVTCKAFFSEGIAPKNMRTPLYAKAVIVDGEGAVLAESEVAEYSIYQYAINRFEKSPTPDQYLLYTAMLDYGASVQKMLVESGKLTAEDVLDDGGWINAYCGINLATDYNGQVVATSETKYYTPGETVELVAEPSYSTDGVFTKIEAADGTEVSENCYRKANVIARTVGVTTYTAKYEITGFTVNTFDNFVIDGSENDANILYKGQSGNTALKNFGVYSASTFGNSSTATNAYQRIDVDSTDSENQVYLVGGNGTVGGNAFSTVLDRAYEGYEKYVVQYDINYHGRKDVKADTTVTMFRLENKTLDDKYDLIIINLIDESPEDETYIFNGVTLNKNEKYTLRFEVVPVNNAMFDLYMYVNGELKSTTSKYMPYHSATYAVDNVQYFLGARFFNRISSDYSYELDNAYVAVEGAPKTGEGAYADNELTYHYDASVSDSAYTIHGTPAGYMVVDGAMYVNGQGASLGIKNSGSKTGTKYVYETDIMFDASAATTTSSSNTIGWWGLSAGERSKAATFASYTFTYGATDGKITTLKINRNDGASTAIKTLYPNEWYNIRIEYTPTTEYQGYVEFYVNGVLAISYTANGYANVGNITNAQLCCVAHEIRGTDNSGVTGLKIAYANTYLNAESPYMPGSGAYYTDANKAGTRYDGTSTDIFAAGSGGTGYFSSANGFLTMKPGANGNPSCTFGIKNQIAEGADALATGNVHVFETDLRISGGYITKPQEDAIWFGMSSVDIEGDAKTKEFLPILVRYTMDENNNISGMNIYHQVSSGHVLLATIDAHEWYNLRFIYTANNTVDEGGNVTAYGGTVDLYINNEKVTTFTTAGYTVGDSDLEPNDVLNHILFQFRGSNYTGGGYTKLDFDNIFLGTFTE